MSSGDDRFDVPPDAPTPVANGIYPNGPRAQLAELRELVAQRESASRARHDLVVKGIGDLRDELRAHVSQENPKLTARRLRGLFMLCAINGVGIVLLMPSGIVHEVIEAVRGWNAETIGIAAAVLAFFLKDWFGLEVPVARVVRVLSRRPSDKEQAGEQKSD